jgi:hypothetical protein
MLMMCRMQETCIRTQFQDYEHADTVRCLTGELSYIQCFFNCNIAVCYSVTVSCIVQLHLKGDLH